jgi:2-polyprenyl-3-methyl-5-hydroxy-6-metoxy-1,4-benzoquinol methylase
MMSDFWENAFKEKQMMWGENPTRVAVETSQLFKSNRFKKVLIPGFGYGRNAKVFCDIGLTVTGIEISETAIAIARNLLGPELRIFHGSVSEMPFDNEQYDGIFCHALIHLLDMTDRKKLIDDCYNQLGNRGMMIFTAITKGASTFGAGNQLGKDRFKTKDGVELFFYDDDSIGDEFGSYGLQGAVKVNEPVTGNSSLKTEFWKIICQRSDRE